MSCPRRWSPGPPGRAGTSARWPSSPATSCTSAGWITWWSDTLSGPLAQQINAVVAAPVQVDYQAIADAQQACPDTTMAARTSNTLQKVKFSNVELLCDTSGPQPWPYIPAAHRRQVFTAFHSLAHPGVKVTGRLMGSRVNEEGRCELGA
jgi:hypothetical protein